MSEAQVPTTDQPEVSVDDLAILVAGMSRVLSGVGRIPVFSEGNIGLAGWAALSVLVRNDGINNRLLARALGVSSQRANQICSALVRDEYVAITQSAADNRANEIRITDGGKAKLEEVRSELKSLLTRALPGKRARALAGAAKHVNNLSRGLNSAQNPAKNKKGKGKAKAKVKAEAEAGGEAA